jgi:pyruvate,orthophosphate dikinase
MSKLLYSISEYDSEATLDLLGGKGYHLMQMTKLGVNVPPGFVITTEVCKMYQKDPEDTMKTVREIMIPFIRGYLMGKFKYMPLVSVRSGAKVSMPGMMDTILNVGMDGSVEEEWCERIGEDCTVDSMHRLITMYGNVVKGLARSPFEKLDVAEALNYYHEQTGEEFPQAEAQMLGAIEAVFKSWNNERAVIYRDLHGISHDLGTAVVIQAMVFGNMNDQSCTGVLFTRNPSTGDNKVTGEFLVNAQGEDVVAGTSTPKNLKDMIKWNAKVAEELLDVAVQLENHYRDMQDIEFTVQDGKLYILQTRSAKRTALAAIKVAVDLAEEGKITPAHAIKRVTMKQYFAAIRPKIPESFETPPHAVGLPASNGVATGVAVFSSSSAVNCKSPCILLAEETTPDDLKGMIASVGILTSKGGATSHAAVVARGMDRVCVVGATQVQVNVKKKVALIVQDGVAEVVINEGDKITIDGESGRIWAHLDVPVEDGSKVPEVQKLKELIDKEYQYLKLVTSADEFNKGEHVYLVTYMMESPSDLIKAMNKAGGGIVDTKTKRYSASDDLLVHGMYGIGSSM